MTDRQRQRLALQTEDVGRNALQGEAVHRRDVLAFLDAAFGRVTALHVLPNDATPQSGNRCSIGVSEKHWAFSENR